MRIKNLRGREILDSRGNPTVEVELTLDNGVISLASVPSGASTGSREALELRDNDENRYFGRGVSKAVNNINTIIKNNLEGIELNQLEIDKLLNTLDSTSNKSYLGANAVLAVSLASLKALASSEGKELYEYISNGKVSLPVPMMNIINGGKHADNSLDIQEFMIVPVVQTFKERLRVGTEIYHKLKLILKEKNLNTNVGDEGGFAPDLNTNEEALKIIVEAIRGAGYVPGKDVYLAIDVAASEIYNKEKDIYIIDGKELSADKLMQYYIELIRKYPIISIEDPFFEDDFDSLAVFTKLVGNKIMIVGDDHFVSNEKYLQAGIDKQAGNSILLKANQIGSVTEFIKTIMLAKKSKYKMIISHRSGETEDTFIADFAVGLNIPFIKTGAVTRGERIAKYNRLLRIEENLSEK